MSYYGLQIINPGSELVISTDGFGLNYVGKATWQSTTAASGTATSVGGKTQGSVVYRITSCPGYPVPFHTQPASTNVMLLNVALVSAGTYDLTYHVEQGAADAYGFATMVNAIVPYVFARQTAAPSGYGVALYDASGTLAYDLSKRQLFPVQRFTFSSKAATGIAITGSPTLPAFFGTYNGNDFAENFLSGSTYEHKNRRWATVVSSTFQIVPVTRYRNQSSFTGISDVNDSASTYFMVDANTLP